MVGRLDKSLHYDFYKQEVDRAIRDCKMWNDRVRLITYTTIITETCDGRPFGWLNYTNPREPQFANFRPNDGDPPNKSWSTQRSGGLFQQQPQFWGPDVMDPYKTTRSFLVGFRFPDGRSAAGLNKIDYMNLPIHVACQKVQGSEFGDGQNYKNNIQYGQMVLDSGTDTTEDWWQLMGTPMDFFRGQATVSQGIVDFDQEPKESIIQSLWGTNRAVNRIIPDAVNNLAGLVAGFREAALSAINAVPNAVVDNLLSRTWPWGNQDDIPVEQRNRENIQQSIFATNTLLYGPDGIEALNDKLNKVLELLEPKDAVPTQEEENVD